MTPRRRALALVTALALLAALSALTRVPLRAAPGEGALLRLSWRARGEELERCRKATPEELAKVPAHMRQETICSEARVAPYRLRVEVDGARVLDGAVAGSGVAGDRPMYVLHDIPLAAGRHRLVVRFERRGPAAAPDERDDDDSPRERRRHAVPPLLLLDTTVTVARHDVRLVTYSPELERLTLLGGTP